MILVTNVGDDNVHSRPVMVNQTQSQDQCTKQGSIVDVMQSNNQQERRSPQISTPEAIPYQAHGITHSADWKIVHVTLAICNPLGLNQSLPFLIQVLVSSANSAITDTSDS